MNNAVKNVPSRFSKDLGVTATTPEAIVVPPIPTAAPATEEVVSAKIVVPEPVQPKIRNTVESKKESFLLIGGKYQILARPDSGYRIIYRILSERCNFSKAEEFLQKNEIDSEQKAKELLDIMLVDASILEDLVRKDADWTKHCQARLERLKTRASKGDASADKTLANEGRIKDGNWSGNIREMFSVCNGSSSEKATNRNIKKFKAAGLMFMMFPRRVKKGQPVYVTMFPSQYREKVMKAKEMVFSGESISPLNKRDKKEAE